MFGKSKDHGGSPMETIIGTGTLFQGTLASKGSIRIDGKVEGSITEADCVVIGESGDVQGDIHAQSVVVGGKVTGNISASIIEVLSAAAIHGDLRTTALAISEGANFEGNCTMIKEKQQIIDLKAYAK